MADFNKPINGRRGFYVKMRFLHSNHHRHGLIWMTQNCGFLHSKNEISINPTMADFIFLFCGWFFLWVNLDEPKIVNILVLNVFIFDDIFNKPKTYHNLLFYSQFRGD